MPIRPHVVQMKSPRSGNVVPNQFILITDTGTYFQSYGTTIAKKYMGRITLDEDYWNHSRTTSKYLHIWLQGHGECHTTADIRKMVSYPCKGHSLQFGKLN